MYFKEIDNVVTNWFVFDSNAWSIRLLRYLKGGLAGVP